MKKAVDIEEALDLVEERVESFRSEHDLDDVFHLSFGEDHFYESSGGGPLARLSWMCAKENFRQSQDLMSRLRKAIEQLDPVIDVEVEAIDEEEFEGEISLGENWYIEFAGA